MSDLSKRVEALRTQVKAMGGGAKIFQEWLVKKLDALLVLPEAPDHMEIPDPPAIPTRTILHVGDEEYELSQAPREEEPEIRLKRYETTIDGEYVTVLKSALEWLESVVNTTSPDGNGPAQDGKPFEAEDFKEELGRWKQHKWFWSVIDDLLSKRTPQKPSELWVCSECGQEFDHRPGPHRVKYGGPLCDGTAFEKGSDRWSCDDCMMRDMTEAEGDAHHASTGHSVSSK